MPPHSVGGGQHAYTLHIYALSFVPHFSAAKGEVTREVLLTKTKDSILDSAELKVVILQES
ncbi:MAG: hypothetical protein KDB22_24805 [Planctomycetales bacterium]|nr:hypothetical protein [Planctomycetales bacterium]